MTLSALLAVVTLTSALPPDPVLRQLAETRKFQNGAPAGARLDRDGTHVFFLRSPPDSAVQALWVMDVATGETRQLLSAEAVLQGAAQQLSAAERAQLERRRVSARGFVSFALSQDGRSLVTPLSGRLYLVDVAALLAGTPPAKAVRALPPKGALDPLLSPDGKRLSYVKDWDLHVLDVATGKERRLTTGGSERLSHGLAEFVAQEEMDRFRGAWWSPDGTTLAYEESDTRGVDTVTLANPARPEDPVQALAYPRPGRPNAKVRLGLVPAAGGKTTWVAWDAERFPYLTQVKWPEKGALTVYVMDRAQQHALLLAVDPRTGKTRTLLEERDAAFLNLQFVGGRRGEAQPLWLPDGSGFFWLTERNGGLEAELRGADGTFRRTWVTVDQALTELSGWDDEEKALYFGASPASPDVVAMRVREGGVPERVIPEPRERVIQQLALAPRGPTRLLTTATPSTLARWDVFDRAGRHRGELPAVRATPLRPVVPELRQVGGPQGFWAAIVRPRDTRPGQKLPTIVSVYGGPHANVVNSAAQTYLTDAWLADQGFLVVSFDNRGTPRRGRAWERAIRKDFAGVVVDDQATALQLLAREVPEVDLARVGITGWSFGGYASALAVLRRPDVFHAAVAGAPVTDWRWYDTFYTERYLGLPDEPGDVYERNSLLALAPSLQRPLLLIHGTTDDNVWFLHTLKLSDALFRAGRPHEVLPLSGFTHMVSDPVVLEAESRRVADFFRAHLAAPAPAVAAPAASPTPPAR